MHRYFTGIAASLLALVVFTSTAVSAAGVEGVRLWQSPEYTRLVFDLSGPVSHKIISLHGPDRLVIDLPDSVLKTSLSGIDLAGSGISRVRSGVRDGDDLRIVLDLRQTLKPRSFLLAKNAEKKDRLVIDLYPGKTAKVKMAAPVARGKRDIVIAIDAGHGGEDPGAIGPRKLREKDVTLAIARQLEARLKKAEGFSPVMVRKGDYYIALQKRRELARQQKADLFVSIHADSFHNAKAQGGSVYALSQRGATSATARFLAVSENKADQIGGVTLGDKGDMLAGVLFDLSMTANLDSSLSVGDRVLRSMGSVSSLHKSRVEQANFVVLRSPDIPSILVETGFISNPREARKLASKAHQQKLAGAIFSGLTHFFESSPPEGSLLASRKRQRTATQQYVVGSGDTLSEIARRYEVSIGSIRRSNGLTSNTIRIGQKLRIPTS